MIKNKMIISPVKKQTLAEQMAEQIKDLILSGELASGQVLPTEPDLSTQFEVSRAVVRDATRILMAKGLVDVQHGRGVFVTQSRNPAFGDALMLALQRNQATVWDVEQFEIILFPEILALATEFADNRDIQELEKRSNTYLDFVEHFHNQWWGKDIPSNETDKMLSLFRHFIHGIFFATKNKVIEQLALPLLNLRNIRQWTIIDNYSKEEYIQMEKDYCDSLLTLIKNKNPEHARNTTRQKMMLPPQAITAMKNTPVGEVSVFESNSIIK